MKTEELKVEVTLFVDVDTIGEGGARKAHDLLESACSMAASNLSDTILGSPSWWTSQIKDTPPMEAAE